MGHELSLKKSSLIKRSFDIFAVSMPNSGVRDSNIIVLAEWLTAKIYFVFHFKPSIFFQDE